MPKQRPTSRKGKEEEFKLLNQAKICLLEAKEAEKEIQLLVNRKATLERKAGRLQKEAHRLSRERILAEKEKEQLEALVLSRYGEIGLEALKAMEGDKL